MAVPLDPAKVDDAIALYQSGKTADEVSDALGIGKTSVYRALERHGLRARPRLRELDTAAIVTRYLAGESELALSRAFGIDRNGIRRRLLEAGISPRGRSAAMFTRMANTSPEDRKKLAQPSHDALRGTKRPFSQKVRRALTREAQGIGISPVEAQFSAALADRGLHTLPQLAVGPYNIDIAAPPVAVEIYGGNWHGSGKHAARSAERFRYILDQGWTVLVVWSIARFPLEDKAAEYVVSLVESARRDPSLIGEYRVIRGDGKLVARGRDNLDELTRVPPL